MCLTDTSAQAQQTSYKTYLLKNKGFVTAMLQPF